MDGQSFVFSILCRLVQTKFWFVWLIDMRWSLCHSTPAIHLILDQFWTVCAIAHNCNLLTSFLKISYHLMLMPALSAPCIVAHYVAWPFMIGIFAVPLSQWRSSASLYSLILQCLMCISLNPAGILSGRRFQNAKHWNHWNFKALSRGVLKKRKKTRMHLRLNL